MAAPAPYAGGGTIPKLIIHSPAGTFDAADRQRIAGALTALGLDCERLPTSPMVRSTVWTYFADHAADAVFMGDEPARLPVVTLQIYVLAGGLNEVGKRRLIEGATAILDRRPNGTSIAPVYIVIHEIAEENWEFSAAKPISPPYARAHPTRLQSDDDAFLIRTPSESSSADRAGSHQRVRFPKTCTRLMSSGIAAW